MKHFSDSQLELLVKGIKMYGYTAEDFPMVNGEVDLNALDDYTYNFLWEYVDETIHSGFRWLDDTSMSYEWNIEDSMANIIEYFNNN